MKQLVLSAVLRYNVHISLREEVKFVSFKELMKSALIPLLVGILVELFSYWLNH